MKRFSEGHEYIFHGLLPTTIQQLVYSGRYGFLVNNSVVAEGGGFQFENNET